MTFRTPPPEFDPEGLIPAQFTEGEWPISSIALDVSGRCNIACRYCAEAATQPARPPMNEETLVEALSIFSTSEPSKGRSIRLGSGEPLIALPLLRRLAEHLARMEEPQPQVYLTTNGILATQEVRDWLVQVGWDVKISLDGPETIHDRWRLTKTGQGTFDRINQAVMDLAARIPANRFSVTAVLCRDSDPREVFEGIAALGVQHIELVPVFHKDPALLPCRKDINRYQQFVMSYANRHLESDDWGNIPVLSQFKRFVFRLMGYNLQSTPCGTGRSFIGISPDRGIYPCFRFIGIEAYRIGSLPEGIDPEAVKVFRQQAGIKTDQRPVCKTCWAAPICGGPCFAGVEMFGPGNGEPIDLQCEYILADAKAAVWLVDALRKQDPDRLLNFFPSQTIEMLEQLV